MCPLSEGNAGPAASDGLRSAASADSWHCQLAPPPSSFGDVKTCVYCRRSNPPSGFNTEHVLPQSLGVFTNNLTLDCVCRDCNDYFGQTTDLAIGRDSVEAILRISDKLKSPAGVSDIRYRNLRLTLSDAGPWNGAVVTMHYENGELVVDLVPQVGLTFATEGFEYLILPELRRLEDGSLKDLVIPGKVTVLHETNEQLAELLHELDRLSIPFNRSGDLPTMDITDERIANISVSYSAARLMSRGLCKLAFNYLCSQKGPDFALRRDFDDIRDFIRSDRKLSWRPFAALTNEINTTREGRQNSDRHHYFMLDFGPGSYDISCQIQLFGTMTYDVLLTRSFQGLVHPGFPVGHYYGLDDLDVIEMRKPRVRPVPLRSR